MSGAGRGYAAGAGIPHSYKAGEDPWAGQRGEDGIWGADALAGIPGGTAEGILESPHLTFALQLTAYQVLRIEKGAARPDRRLCMPGCVVPAPRCSSLPAIYKGRQGVPRLLKSFI
jgi:hypothetical protein